MPVHSKFTFYLVYIYGSGGVEEIVEADTGAEGLLRLQHENRTFSIETYGCQVRCCVYSLPNCLQYHRDPMVCLTPCCTAPEATVVMRCGTRLANLLSLKTVDWQMNVADSEVVRAVMGGAGYQWTETTEAADVVFLNTCAIRGTH